MIWCVVFVAQEAQCATRARIPADPDVIMFPGDSEEQIVSRGGLHNSNPAKDVRQINQEVLNHVNTNPQGDS